MIELDNRTSLNIDFDMVEDIANKLSDKLVELIITNNEEIKQINKDFRNIDKETDVLSFPYEDMPMAPLGSIVISHDYVKEIASKLNHSEEDECNLLFIHGMLHLLGLDHEVDNGEMREKEAALIQEFNLPSSLIVRNNG